MPTSYSIEYNGDFSKLKVEIRNKKAGEGATHVHQRSFDDNPLVTSENAEVWAVYLEEKIGSLINKEVLDSKEFKNIAERIARRKREEKEWKANVAERRRVAYHRNRLRRTPKQAYIPDGLNVDYSKEYSFYVGSAIKWTPEDTDDFLYQTRSLERMVTKCYDKCMEANRPDAAFAQALEICRHLPLWKSRTDLSTYFNIYQLRLRKLVRIAYNALTSSAIAWNNASMLKEANNLIEAQADIYEDWGLKRNKVLALRSDTVIAGEPIHIERKPNKYELEDIRREQRRKEAEEKRKAEEEAGRHSLIPLNEDFDKRVFNPSNIDWECRRIGSEVYNIGKRITKLIDNGKPHEAILAFLQLVKSMCRHFVADRHWTMFDDMYDPDIFCNDILRNIKKAYHDGKIPQQDIDFLLQAWKEIESTETRQSYGIAYYDMKF